MQLVIQQDGNVKCPYGEELDLRQLGKLTIQRASHVEPDAAGRWLADLSPVAGLTIGPFATRSEALTAEEEWLVEHRLG